MSQRLTDAIVRALPAPAKGNRVTYDAAVKGFGVRVTANGSRAFVFNYRLRATGRERRYTIGRFPDWTTTAAREEARRLRRCVDGGADPLAELETERQAETVAELAQRFTDQHLPKLRLSTQTEYRAVIKDFILPALEHRKVADAVFTDIDALHRKMTKAGAPYRANRAVAVCSKMFNLAIKWGWCAKNPAVGVERNQEQKRHRYLSADELIRLTEALAAHHDQQAANMFRLLLLTGARRGEVQSMRWADLDLEAAVWTKPGAMTKQKTLHRVPISEAACALLRSLREAAPNDAEFVFAGRGGGHRVELKKAWAAFRKQANLGDARIHDLRHTYASVLASAGLSLPVIGALLGHSQPATTARYAHLLDDPLRAATERASAIITGKPSALIVELPAKRGAR